MDRGSKVSFYCRIKSPTTEAFCTEAYKAVSTVGASAQQVADYLIAKRAGRQQRS